jgi:hypothetical protein
VQVPGIARPKGDGVNFCLHEDLAAAEHRVLPVGGEYWFPARQTSPLRSLTILYSLNKPDDFILAIVELDSDSHRVIYVRRPFGREPDSGVASVTIRWSYSARARIHRDAA